MSTYIPSTAETILCMIGLIILACLLAHLKKPTTPGRNEQLIRHHRRIQERQLGEAYRDDGYTMPFVLFCITGLLGAHALLAIGWAITCAVFGCEQPRW
ncbi:MAG: hypothetical protein WAW39_17115 [Prosthecobacter sp.]|uniref:hypothetical protein n=1 Tax=Prosthecobacter sp. TaxID=1965333 RepID=UPI003BB19F03